MKRSWGFLIPKYYNYGFKNFYATVIQRAYRNYKKRPESLAKWVWKMVRNDGTPDDMKFLRRIPSREYWGFGSNDLEIISEKEVQLRLRLTNIAFILSLKLLYQQGYIVIRGSIWEVDWTDMLKWPQNPEYYHINKKYNFGHNALHKNFVRISEYKNYRCKELGACDSMTKFPALIQLYNATIVDLLDMDNNCEFVRRIFQISP
ncbi:hypothetical protein RhiirC2_818558 [Rhizophagus irregularis]|uniref:Uncharacterized protein n=1 Tax=Rhizophagus irregularis TaxID=588596 RepID=A0A2N1MFK1_9GLOM|nr:hypothetical protein RhiirC2_818558 [Rhizophagus irregularis]